MALESSNALRMSLSPGEIQAGVGAELLSLCQSMTADGVLTDPEIAELEVWLADNRDSNLPAIAFLTQTLEHILADRKVTPEERIALHQAIEVVLPAAARHQAIGARMAVEAAGRESRDAEAERDRETQERYRAVATVNFLVAGVHYQGRRAVVSREVHPGDQVYLVRVEDETHGPTAVEVRTSHGFTFGYVPLEDSRDLAPLLDEGLAHRATVTQVLCGGRVSIPVIKAQLFRPDSPVEGIVRQDQCPPSRTMPIASEAPPPAAARKPCSTGCGGTVAMLLLLATLGAGFLLR